MNKRKQFQHIRLALLSSLMIFVIMLITITIMFLSIFAMYNMGIINRTETPFVPLLMVAMISIVLGTVLTFFLSSIPIKPVQSVLNAIERVAGGDYSVRLELKGPDPLMQVAEQFNLMAEELQSVELLRTDFVNNFSREFKTPIVSIRGFAKLLKNDDLTDEERNEYLDIIVDESERLSELATNVLELSKLEQQSILTNRTTFNVSEQLRLVIAMMYQKWQDKNTEILFDSREYMLTGNEEMLKQAWINLLDNALKFSPDYGSVHVQIWHKDDHMVIRISDHGAEMSDETAAHIFDKFYQGDTSHTTAGNGLGLTITAKIIALHGGSIRVAESTPEGSTFEVILPHSVSS